MEADLKSIPDDELLRRLSELLRQSRRVEADLVAHIGEVESRRLYAREAASSMFVYCTEVLRLSGAEAYLRIAAARASREHPVLLEMLRDGRLHLTAIERLSPHLTADNQLALLRRATHASKRQIEALVAELAPRPDVPAVMRKIPARRALAGPMPAVELRPDGVATSAAPTQSHAVASSDRPRAGGSAEVSAAPGPQRASDGAGNSSGSDRMPTSGAGHEPVRASIPSAAQGHVAHGAAAVPPRPAAIEILAPARYKVQFTASAELHDKLERLRALMRGSVADGDLGAIIEQAVSEKLERLEARRFAITKHPRSSPSRTDVGSRYIPAAVRRAVHERDRGQCGFVDTWGRRCAARERLEFHHRHPFAHGGEASIDNIRLLCRTHNQLVAEADYGQQAMARHRRAPGHARGSRGLRLGDSHPLRAARVPWRAVGPGSAGLDLGSRVAGQGEGQD